MLRRARCRLGLPLQPTHAVPFAISSEEAATSVTQHYAARWFGAKLEYLKFGPPETHLVPFYTASGMIECVYSASVEHRVTTTDSKGNSHSSSTWTTIPPVPLRKAFFDHNTQIYAGYRRDPKHVQVLMGPHLPTLQQPFDELDRSGIRDMNLFEMSKTTLQRELDTLLRKAVRDEAEKRVRDYNAGASSVKIKLESFQVAVSAVTPLYAPAQIVPAEYDGDTYKIVVCGVRGAVSGPRLYNPEAVARACFVGAAASSLVLARVGGAAFWNPVVPFASALGSIAAYYAGFYLARAVPRWRIAERRKQQAARMAANASRGGSGADADGTDDASGGPRHNAHKEWINDSKTSHPSPQDPKGYYARLGVERNASVNDIKAAYRRMAMQYHPDMAGSKKADAGKMAAINEAYQTLRNPTKRQRYDNGGV